MRLYTSFGLACVTAPFAGVVRRRGLLRLGLISVVALLTVGIGANAATADSDVTPPELRALSVVTPSVDVSSGGATVTMDATITDDLSGYRGGTMYVRSPSGQLVGANPEHVSGDTYQIVFDIPQYAEAGVWRTYYLDLIDNAGNRVSFDDPGLLARGFDVFFEVTADSDVTPPELRALSVVTPSVDVSSGGATVTMDATITDDLSGYRGGTMYVRSPSGQLVGANPEHVSGDTYQIVFDIPQYAEAGVWRTYYLDLIDNAGNRVSFDDPGLLARGFDVFFEVTADSDVTPPELRALSVVTPSVDVSSGGATVTMDATITDDLSGYRGGTMYVRSPSGQLVGANPEHVSGDTYQIVFDIPQYAEAGVWRTYYLDLIDNAGNRVSFDDPGLLARGFDVFFEVTADSDVTPPAIRPTIGGDRGTNGWYTSNVSVTWTVTDPESAITSTTGCDAVTLIAETAGRTLTCSATSAGGTATETVTIKIDKTAPTTTCSANPATLWPPNHRLVAVTASTTVGDGLSGPAGFTLESVASSEPDSGMGTEDIANDIQGFTLGAADTTGMLRAERFNKDGRVYTLRYVGRDRAGNTGKCTAVVRVPHDAS